MDTWTPFRCPQCGGWAFGRDAGTSRFRCNSDHSGRPLSISRDKPCGWQGVYFIQIQAEPSEAGGYTMTIPAMPGCISEGDTLAGALRNLAEAVELYQDEPGTPDSIEPLRRDRQR